MGAFDFMKLPKHAEVLEDLGTYRGAFMHEAAMNDALSEELGYLSQRVVEVEEDLLRISDAFDNVGWAPLDPDNAKELSLETVKKIAEVARAMNAMNPFVKRGVNARISYVFGRGVKFDGIESIKDEFSKNRSKLFAPQAYEELERVLAPAPPNLLVHSGVLHHIVLLNAVLVPAAGKFLTKLL